MFNDIETKIEDLQAQINALKREAEIYQQVKPEHAVINARKACEAICTHICIKKGLIDKKTKNSLDGKINKIIQHALAPRTILDDMKFIQLKGNTVAHCIEKINPEDAEPALKALSNIVNWYFKGSSCEEPKNVEPKISTTIRTESGQDNFKKKAKKVIHNSLFQKVAVGVIAGFATALVANASKKKNTDG